MALLLRPVADRLESAYARFQSIGLTVAPTPLYQQLDRAAQEALKACRRFINGPDDRRAFGAMLQATRCYSRACESLYAAAGSIDSINQFFLEEPFRQDQRLLQELLAPGSRVPTGIMQFDNPRDGQGGFSLYVPEFTEREQLPLVVALHGGRGHGADFLWTWLRSARSRGFILATPTSRQHTWSLRGPDEDLAPLFAMVAYIRAHWPVDSNRIMLSGLSDGGSYALLAGLDAASPFTHLVSCAGVLHPRNIDNGNLQRAAGKPIYLVHGSLDWMFPIQSAYRARELLTRAGAALVFSEVEDLSHNWAFRESDRILSWFDRSLALPAEFAPITP